MNYGNNVSYNIPYTNTGEPRYYPYSFTKTTEIKAFGNELSQYELMINLMEQFNALVTTVNNTLTDFAGTLDLKEDKAFLTTQRKLSEIGDFTGTLCGSLTACQAVAKIKSNEDNIDIIINEINAGLPEPIDLIDGGYFEDPGTTENIYDGGDF